MTVPTLKRRAEIHLASMSYNADRGNPVARKQADATLAAFKAHAAGVDLAEALRLYDVKLPDVR